MPKPNKGGGQPNQGGQPSASRNSLTVKSEIKEKAGKFGLTILVSYFVGGKAANGGEAHLYVGLKKEDEKTINKYGVATFKKVFDAASAGQTLEYRIMAYTTDSEVAETTISVEVPEMKSPPKPVGPEKMLIRPSNDGKGNFTLNIRVLNADTKGVKADVVINEGGKPVTKTTDAKGMLTYPLSKRLAIGEKRKVYVTADDIADEACLELCRPMPKVTPPAPTTWWGRFCLKVGLDTNNRRARWLWRMVIILTLVMFFWVGVGGSYLSQKELTTAQIQENKVAQYMGEKPVYVLAKKADPNSYLWVFYFIFVGFTVVYGVASVREEVGEALGEYVEKAMEREYTSVSDPLFVRIANHYGVLAMARNPVSKSSSTSESKSTGWGMFSKILSAELIGETAIELIWPAIKRSLLALVGG